MEENKTKEKAIIERIKKQLSKKLREEDGYKIASEVRWGSTSSNMVCDLVIRNNKYLIAIFEIVLLNDFVRQSRDHLIKMAHIDRGHAGANLPILVIYCEEDKTFKITFPVYISEILQKKSFYKSYDLFKPIAIESKDINLLVRIIKDVYKIKIDTFKEINTDIGGDDKQLKFYQSSEKVLDPNWCREQLGVATCKNGKSKKITCKEICRYSSLDSLFSSLRYKTIRMNGLPGMNDRNEGLFAWNMIYKLDQTDNEENKKRRRETNNAFIVSYSSSNLIDDLNQWRLYGDDAKGVCCVYSILQDKLKDRFFLHNVRYIKESNGSDNISDGLLRLFLEYSKDHSDLSYYDLSPAIFFYKPDSYKTEDEIRLLVDNKKTKAYNAPEYKREWVLTNANNIPNPYIDISIDDIPIKLEKIILGPNMNDVDTIQAQLETLLEQQGISAIVELSSIKSYRNSDK